MVSCELSYITYYQILNIPSSSGIKASIEKAGGKLIGTYYTMGEYDVVIIIVAPNDETVMSLMLKVGSLGNARTKTLKAFTAEEGIKIIKDLV
jgi:uncharacterized protein with GYD domain